MKVRIVDMDHKGNGIGRINNKIVFMPQTVLFNSKKEITTLHSSLKALVKSI